jgi:adenine-specific DNA-methyltransferase
MGVARMNGKQHLGLDWVGKNERSRLEPRILIEDVDKSYHAATKADGDIFDNILIHGDNLLALKALESEFFSKIKCVYIDPPFNTQQAFEHYDDGIEHSIWLSLMRDRLLIIRNLLTDDGTIFIHIDDNELGYLLVLCDEIFGRKNKCFVVTFRQASATGHKSINPGCVLTTNYILIYAKDKSKWRPNRVFTGRERDKRYGQFILNFEGGPDHWKLVPLAAGYAAMLGVSLKDVRRLIKTEPEKLDEFVLEHAKRVVQLARPDYEAVGKDTKALIDRSESQPKTIFVQKREEHSDIYLGSGPIKVLAEMAGC